MAKVNLPGVAKTTKTLTNGTRQTYYYVWRGGPLLKNKDGTPAQPHQLSFAVEYAKHQQKRKAQSNETLATLIEEYYASSEFKNKIETTRRSYKSYLEKLPSNLKDIKIKHLENKRVRGIFKRWRDSRSATPRAADYALASVARVLSHAHDNGRITINILTRVGRLHTPDRAEIIWTDAHLKLIAEEARPDIKLAVFLALNTSQRKKDLLHLPLSSYDGDFIKVKQSKTKEYVKIPVFGMLKELLDENIAARMKKRYGATTLLVNSRGRAWTSDGFDSSFQKTKKKLKIEGVTFHDLRGTSVTYLALAGCTSPEIASFTGHSLDDVNSILDAHYMGGRAKLAVQAAEKLIEFNRKKDVEG